MNRTGPAALAILVLTLGGMHVRVAACVAADKLMRHEYSQVIMGMEFKLLFYAADESTAKRAAERAFGRVAELNSVLSDYDPQSELSQLSLSSSDGGWVPLSLDLWTVLDAAQQLARRTEGAFDVTAGPLIDLWRRARRQRELPIAERIEAARVRSGYRWLELDPVLRRARLRTRGMRLDLGGIGAGYAADEALRVLAESGIHIAMVDASGDVATRGAPAGQMGWRVGIAPVAPGDELTMLELAGKSAASSGDTEQYVEINGRRYSHIVDPHTGFGLTNRIAVTVIAPTCMHADCLSTAVSVLGPRMGLELVESLPDTECRIVQLEAGDPQIVESSGFREFVVAAP